MFFFYGFLSSAHYLFVSSRMFWYTLVFTRTDYIYWTIKLLYWKKIKLSKFYIGLKLAIRAPWGLLKDVQSENIWRCFESLLITSNKCHKLPSRVYCHLWAFFVCEIFHSIERYFHKTILFFTFLDLLTLNFLLDSDCSKCTRLKAIVR